MTLLLSGTDGLSDVDGSAATPAIRGTDTNTGIFFPAADTIAFAEGGAEVARFDSSGNLGIGTTSPSAKLDLVGNSGLNVAKFQQSGAFQPAYITSTTNLSGVMSETNNQNGLLMNSASNFTSLWSGGAERMRITSSGNLLVGTTSLPSSGPGNAIQGIYLSTPFNGIAVRTTGAADSYECYAGIRNSTNGSVAAWWYNESTLVGRIAITSSATSYITSSDYRLKENIAPMTGALDKVAQLKPVTYTWKADGSNGQGFIAHELQEVCPDAVTGEKDAVNEDGSINPQGIDTSFLVATLTAAIQEQQAIITDLKARIETLETK